MTKLNSVLGAWLLCCAVTCGALASPDDVAGWWLAEPEFGGSPGVVGLEILRGDEGGLTVILSLPSVDAASIPIGKAAMEGDVLRTGIGDFSFDPVAGTLSGVLPSALVPVHRIPVTFTRGQSPGPPAASRDFGVEAAPAWIFAAGGPVYGSPAVADETVYVGSDDGFLYALEAGSGRQLWRFPTGGAVRARPTLDDGEILFPSDDGRLYCLAAETGQVSWAATVGTTPAPRSDPGSSEFRYDHFSSAATVGDGMVFVGTLDGDVVAVDRDTGAARWRFQTDDAVTSTPALYGDSVLFGSFDHHVYAVNARDGTLRWRFDTGAPVVSSPALAEGVAIIGSRSYDLFGLDAGDGAVRWRFYDWFSWVESSATVVDGVAYVGSSDSGRLRAIRADDGRVLWSFDTPGSAWGTPAVTADRVFIGSVGVRGYFIDHRPGFFAVDRGTGRPVWWYPMERPEGSKLSGVVSSPAAAAARVYVGGLDGVVYAFPIRP